MGCFNFAVNGYTGKSWSVYTLNWTGDTIVNVMINGGNFSLILFLRFPNNEELGLRDLSTGHIY